MNQQVTLDQSKDNGIPCCVNCIGIHPDEPIKVMDVMMRANDPSRYIASKLIATRDKLDLYKNKSCMLCGRTYDGNGALDETWELTAKRVKMEFGYAGVDGVSDTDVKKVVASCIKSWKVLWSNRQSINTYDAEKMTFAGRLALIITHAQEARVKRNTLNNGKSLDKGIIV